MPSAWQRCAEGWPGLSPGMAARIVAVAAMIACIAFVIATQRHELHLYADGGMMSYAVAVQDSWRFLWRNMSGRLLPYVVAYVPAETLVALTGSPAAGVRLYAFLFSVAPAMGLALAWRLDRTPGRVVFHYGCLSTVLLCPLVFGFPTELWFTQAMLWPVLAMALNPPAGLAGQAGMAVAVLALLETHESATLLGLVAVAAAVLFGETTTPDGRRVQARGAWIPFVPAYAAWAGFALLLPPDAYVAPIRAQVARQLAHVGNLVANPVSQQVLAALAGFVLLSATALALRLRRGFLLAAGATGLGLVGYWIGFDTPLHAEERYLSGRLVLILGMLVLAVAAVAHAALRARAPHWRILARLRAALLPPPLRRTLLWFGGFAAVLLVAVSTREVVQFAEAWDRYRVALRELVLQGGPPPPGQVPPAVSTAAIPDDLQRLAWNSTAPFLSVLLVPGYSPAHYAADPEAGYFPLDCALSLSSVERRIPFPAATRRMLHDYNCRFR